MGVQSILVPIYGGAHDQSVLRRAGALAAGFAAAVDVVYVRPENLTPSLIDDSVFGALAKGSYLGANDEFEDGEAGFDAARRLIESSPGTQAGVRWRLLGPERAPTGIGELSRLSDLVVMPLPVRGDRGPAIEVIYDVLERSGRPVLAVPDGIGAGEPSSPRRVLIGWDGGRSAARAVGAALPFLGQAQQVVVASYGPSAAEASRRTNGLAAYLAQHEIAAKTIAHQGDRRPTNVHLLNDARAEDADLIVIGAGTDGWLRRLVNGGLTRAVLARTPLPVLIAS